MPLYKRALTAAAVLGGLATICARAASPYAVIDSAQGELPKTVIPVSYKIEVAPDPKTMKIAGHETIAVIARRPVDAITLNALQTTFGRVTIDGAPARVRVDAEHQRASFSLGHPIAAGAHALDITYTATLQTAAQGLFKQVYSGPDRKPAFMYGTQLEATDARRLFPSWDEPVYKTPFAMSFVVPKAWTAVSNTPIVSSVDVGADRKRVSFAPTPKMSTYLVVLCAGDFDKISTVSDGIKLAVYSPRGDGPSTQYALSVMKDLMPYYDSYYGVKFPISKLDTIAIPGGFLGAMENWGGITYNDSTILFDPHVQPDSAKKNIFDIIAHEESHQWNGDLTTFAWWDDVWLAEGFATWMQTKAPDHFHPEWHMYISADDDVQGALSNDAQITTHPVYIPIHNETQAAAVFDSISYTKAGAVLRMLEQYMGPRNFQIALQHYFRTHQYTSFSAADLWRDLGTQSHANVAAITHNWIYQPGFPLVTASVTCANGRRSIALSQQRYLNDTSVAAGSTVWSIPMNVQTDATGRATKAVLFNAKSATIDGGSCNTPLVLNGDAVGFFRTQYDAQTRASQQAAFLKFSTADRLNLLADSRQFVNSGRAQIADYLAYAKADAGDTDPLVVGAVLEEYQTMLAFELGKPGEAALKTLIVARVKPMLPTFGGWDGAGMNDDQLGVRNKILTLLALSGDSDTLAEGKARFAKLVANPNAFAPLDRSAIVGVAGYAADPAIYQQLFGMAAAAKSPQEQQQDFFSLFGANDPALAQQSLNAALHLPPQFAPYAPFIVVEVGQSHPDLAWKFLNANSDKLFATMSQFELAQAVTGVASAFATHIPSDQIEAFMKAHAPKDGGPQIKQAMDNIHTQEAIQNRVVPQIDAYVASSGATASR
jgi:aminopeptidase N